MHLVKDNMAAVLTITGLLAGYLSFIRLLFGDLRDWYKKPRLKIEFDRVEDQREWTLRGPAHIRMQKVATVHIRNKRRLPALRCVAVLRVISTPAGCQIPQKEFVLHWADTDYTSHTNVAEPVEIGIERRRLDVAFSFFASQESSRGAWIAIPIALSDTSAASQAWLSPGEYRFQLIVECANGKGTSKKLTIFSPEDWRGLSMQIAP